MKATINITAKTITLHGVDARTLAAIECACKEYADKSHVRAMRWMRDGCASMARQCMDTRDECQNIAQALSGVDVNV